MGDLTGKVALVTGAGGMRGMGRAIAVRLAKGGADVVVVDHPDVSRRFSPQMVKAGWKGLASVVEEIQGMGRQGLAVDADLSSSTEVEKVVNSALQRFSRIDILVNNAAISGPYVHAVDLEEKDWERVLRVNLTGPFLISKAVAKSMIRRGEGGKIVMIASIVGKRSDTNVAAYAASKAGVLSLTQTLAAELAPHKILVNAVCPGAIWTDIGFEMTERLAKEKGISYEKAQELRYSTSPLEPLIPLGKRGTSEDIAGAAAFLAGPESNYITGQALNVCGGWLMVR